MKYLLIIIFIIPLIFNSCKKEEIKPVTNTTSAEEQARDAFYDLMQSWYLWYKQMPSVTVTDYKDPIELLNAIRYRPVDRWSFVMDYNTYVSRMVQGVFVGHGISIGMDGSNNVRIVKLYKESELYKKFGVRRGWILKKLNGSNLSEVILSGNSTLYSQLWGASEAGVVNTFVFQTPLGKDSTITSTKSSLIVNTVMVADTLHLRSGITGHLVYDQFIEPTAGELRAAFAFFKQNNVKDLIIDMRYNGGGYENVLQELASYVAGNKNAGTPIMRLKFNDKHPDQERNVPFTTTDYPLDLPRLIVISSRSTASASEEVINGLRAIIPVTVIGDTTEGKPTGMALYNDLKKKYVFAPVEFEAVNSKGEGGFYKGIPPAKYVPDDLTHDFSDRNELCLKEAIRFLETGSFSQKSTYVRQPVKIITEDPEWTRNLIIKGN